MEILLDSQDLVEIMISYVEIRIDNESRHLTTYNTNSDELSSLQDYQAADLLSILQDQFEENSFLLHGVSDSVGDLDEVKFSCQGKQVDTKLSYQEGSILTKPTSNLIRMFCCEILSDNQVGLTLTLPPDQTINDIIGIELQGEDYKTVEMYSFDAVSILLGEEKIPGLISSESFGRTVSKWVTIETEKSSAYIDMMQDGFEEEFADDFDYAFKTVLGLPT